VSLPRATEDYLAHGASNGGRNSALFDAACQFRDDRKSFDEAAQTLMQRATADGLARGEALRTIKSAFSRGARKPCNEGVNGDRPDQVKTENHPTYRKIPVTPEPLPPPLDDDAIRYLQAKFLPGEWVSIGEGWEKVNEQGEVTLGISGGKTRTLEAWITDIKQRSLDAIFPRADGLFVRVNPMKDGTGKNDEGVAVYRDILLESDQGSLEDQLGAIRQIGLTISALAYSGDRSIQAHLRVNAPDEKTYRDWFEVIRQFCCDSLGLEMDKQNVNPSRYSRLPGGKRALRDHDTNEKILVNGQPVWEKQTLLEVNIPGKNWHEWFESLPLDDGLPEDTDLHEFMRVEIREPPHLLTGLLRKHQVMIVSGASKTYKSWTAMEIALAVSQGGRFAKWDAHVGKVYYVDTELEEYDFQARMRSIMSGGGYDPDPGDFRKLLLRGTRSEISKLVDKLGARLKGNNYDLIVIDAIYSLLGDREENSNEDITQVGIELFRLAKLTSAAVLFIHHFSKGSQQGKRGIEKPSGAGAWGRFPDGSLAIDKHQTEEFCYNFEVTSRTFPEDKPFVARRINGLWRVEEKIKVAHKGGVDLTDFLHILVREGNGSLSPADWKTLFEQISGLKSRNAFDSRRDAAVKEGLIVSTGQTNQTRYRLADGVQFNEQSQRYEKEG
jgi:RecA-family ATPase